MIIPVILSGGSGARLWPLSRKSHPKPFLKLPDGETLLQKTFSRVCSLEKIDEIITITNQEYFFKSQIKHKTTAPPHTFLLEPFARNTAPAIALAALKAATSHGDDAILLVLPADHLIEDNHAFIAACYKAFALAKAGFLVTFGIKPTKPETGFGYIECGEWYESLGGFKVKKFIEKPSQERAIQLLKSNNYFWNAGIFCFKVNTILNEYASHAPLLLSNAKTCWEKSQHSKQSASVYHLDAQSFEQFENISIDYALLEKSNRTAVVPCHFGWSDIGSWSAYKALHQTDKNGNAIVGDAILLDSHDNLIYSENRMIAAIGLQNLIVVDTPDALLVATNEKAQDVKNIVQKLQENEHTSYHSHRTVQRPWGTYTVLEEKNGFKVKRIVVHAGGSLSLQSHKHRSEHWVVVEGIARIINGNEEFMVKKNDTVLVPQTNMHRISNPGTTDLVIIEVQIGDYLGEDDITRFDDVYGRTTDAKMG